MRFLDECCKSCDNLYLTGLMTLDPFNGAIPVARFSWPRGKGRKFASPKFGDCYIGGAGGSDFENLLRSAEGARLKNGRILNECENVVFAALTLAAQLSGQEATSGCGLAEFYGGGCGVG